MRRLARGLVRGVYKHTTDVLTSLRPKEHETINTKGWNDGQVPVGRTPSSEVITRASRRSVFLKAVVMLAVLLVIRLVFITQTSDPSNPMTRLDQTGQLWENFPRMNGYYKGLKSLVASEDWIPEEEVRFRKGLWRRIRESGYESTARLLRPQPLPYVATKPHDLDLASHLIPKQCFLDAEEKRYPVNIFAHHGVPQGMTAPLLGSYEELGLKADVCFDRYGRFGPYGYDYSESEGGLGLGNATENASSEIWRVQPRIDYRGIDWSDVQKRCVEKNKGRFSFSEDAASIDTASTTSPRTAFVLRTYVGIEYTSQYLMTLRAMVNELCLKTGGQYAIHLLVHVRDDSIPIWESKKAYQSILEQIPAEFRNSATLWNVPKMLEYYPGPFDNNFENADGQTVHSVYRRGHFALQWFAQNHPEYEYFWNWEMDMRYTGDYYDFIDTVSKWAQKQPRKGLWERNAKVWIPSLHGNFAKFTSTVSREIERNRRWKGIQPVWGPITFPSDSKNTLSAPPSSSPPTSYDTDTYTWGVSEPADLITFTPIFDPSSTDWIFHNDITGYNLSLPIPPRRAAITTPARYSRRLLDIMHRETSLAHHSAFVEMCSPTIALHHGLKAVYVPHPIFFDREWPLSFADEVFNKRTLGPRSSFGESEEHNWAGSSYFFNAGFGGALWRRWMGEEENGEGGAEWEAKEGRMCLRGVLLHPVKTDLRLFPA